MNNIDKLFRNKLDSHEVIPSAEAWGKINSQLNRNKRKKGAIWMSAAAAVTLVIVSITYFNNEVPNDNNDLQISEILPEKEVVEGSINQIEESNTQGEINKSNKIIQTAPETIVAKHKKSAVPATKIDTEVKGIITNTIASNSDNTIVDNKLVVEATSDVIEENKTLIALNENNSKHKITQPSSVKITYNLQPVVKIDSSVFTKKEIGIDSKSGVLGKIVAFAKNAKASDVSLGQLRAAKDDLLSFDNLKGDKQTQNK